MSDHEIAALVITMFASVAAGSYLGVPIVKDPLMEQHLRQVALVATILTIGAICTLLLLLTLTP